MLRQTFIHIPGVGKTTEQELWANGIQSWEDADRFDKCFGHVSARLQRKFDEYIPRSREAIKRGDAAFFGRLSRLGEAWRLFPEFADRCVYLDIETTGLSTVFDRVTMVGLYDGRKYTVLVDGDNLHELPERLLGYSVIVTYNGSGFDLRFLRLAFPNLTLPPIHIDLRWITRKLGMGGGLKAAESKLGLTRPGAVEDITGYDATVLWAKYLRGDKGALERLIQYNTEDVVHLKAIMEMAYEQLSRRSAKFLAGCFKPMFKGVSPLPRSNRRSVLKRAAVVDNSSDLVLRLLQQSPAGSPPRIVGIDLTGSEKRATGWALMEGAVAITRCISTDEELLAATIAAHPDVVSIDSPLSLPEPRKRGRTPIYRRCELALKRMGISVFWCLLPSMQSLTMRGIRLAEQFRRAGLKVIESYPGAAQDVLGIPRKGASLEELKLGLGRAGIEGEYLTTHVVHDEVDAITSALVGLFYLADDYIALGTPAEEHLIVPRSERFNYTKLAEILSETGLDEVPAGTELQSPVYESELSAPVG